MGDKLDGRTLLLCGGAGALERRIALRCAEDGASIVLINANRELSLAVVADVEGRNGSASFVDTDLRDEAAVQSAIGDAIMTFGSIDGLIFSSPQQPAGDALEIDGPTWDAALDLDLRGAWLCCRNALPFLKRSGHGSIVLVARSDARATTPRALLAATCSSALLGMTRSLAIDLGPHGIRANAILTGYVETDESHRALAATPDPEAEVHRILAVHPLGRFGRPRDVAGAVVFLLSDDAAFVTGSELLVDGGRAAVAQNLFL